MKLSVIIVNWNVCDLLYECLTSFYAEMHLSSDEYEVIVVDNASTDNSLDMLINHFPQVDVIANSENVGFARANNQAFPRCRGEYVLLLNPDTVIIDGAVNILLRHASKHEDVAVMGCRLLNRDLSLQRWTGGAYPNLWNIACHYLMLDRILPTKLRSATLYLNHDYEQDIDVDWVSGAVMLLKRSSLGGAIFDESFFMYGEDMECCHRLKSKGWRIVYTSICSIIHVQGASMKKQEGEILLSSLKGIRSFYMMIHGSRSVWLLDYLTLTGFFLRWCCFSVMKLLRPAYGYKIKSSSSWHHMQIARKIMKQA